MLRRIVKTFGGDPNKKTISKYADTVDQINGLENEFEALSDELLAGKTDEFRARLEGGETLNEILVEAFATVREVSKRTLGMRHYDVQLIGGLILHAGEVAEMRTGEGKTLMSTLPLYLNALSGNGVHLITVNDYLARRDARWMTPIFDFLGLSIGVLQMGSRTEGGQKGFIVNLEKEASSEDQHQLEMVDRRQSYEASITYGTNNEFGFDYLRDNMKLDMTKRSQVSHHFAIIDEVDNVLIDEARTPLIISGPSHDDAENYLKMAKVVKRLKPADYEVSEKDRTVVLSELGETRVEEILGVALRDPERPEDITPEQSRLLGYLEQAMRAQFLFKRNKDYLVQGGQVVIIDEFTGRLMPGRRWSDGLHQAAEAKEGVKIQSENITHATITIQNYFRMYEKLSGMTGTAITEAEEFHDIYKLEVTAVPPNVDYNALGDESYLIEHQAKDNFGYEYTYYSLREDPEQKEALYRRKDYPDVIFRTKEAKLRAIVQEIMYYHVIGRPLLVGTTSVEASERLSTRMRTNMVRRLCQAIVTRQVWLEENEREEDGRLIMALSFLHEPLDKVDSGRMRDLGKQLNIPHNIEDEKNLTVLLFALGLEEEHRERLHQVIKKGLPQQVLNARKHTEESQIIAGAGAFGAVTIATNMAGRGVDIKLGGEVAEEILTTVNRVLRRNGIDDPFGMTMEEKLAAIRGLSSDDYGIYESEIKYFIKSMEDMVRVKDLGGLHVIGSERHDARRIDNQLRGRAARQGDSGSSRFYLSLEDDLMRLFGGAQVDAVMQRLKVDDAMPLENKMVTNIIEQSQTRVEGANFDSRKHLLEYDDVLNAQRETIYAQRDHIFLKDDLSEDVTEMLQMEIERRIPESLLDEEGPWKLLSWLEQIQPTIVVNNIAYPSFTYKLLLDSLGFDGDTLPVEEVQKRLLELVDNSLEAEASHMIRGAEGILQATNERLESQLKDKYDSLDTFFEGLYYVDETDTRNPNQILEELIGVLGVQVKIENKDIKLFRDDPEILNTLVGEQLDQLMESQAVARVIGAIERRLGRALGLDVNNFVELGWDEISAEIMKAIQDVFDKRSQQLVGKDNDGIIARELKETLSKIGEDVEKSQLLQLMKDMILGEVRAFDKRTHREIRVKTTRLTYIYHAGHFLEKINEDDLTKQVLSHLQEAQKIMIRVWGITALNENGNTALGMLRKSARERLAEKFGSESFDSLKSTPLNQVGDDKKEIVVEEMGRLEITTNYRQLILRVISELWIEYLTKMEALRVSIGLEAYAQRDPLVQYKTRASQMFQELFQDMRMSVVSRMFTHQQRRATPKPVRQPAMVTQGDSPGKQENGKGSGKKKRKRKRKR